MHTTSISTVIGLMNEHNSLKNGGEDSVIGPEIKQYIMHRFKTMSHFSECVPYEYPPHQIRSDMEKAGIDHIPDEYEIEDVISSSKLYSRAKVLSMLRDGRTIAEIREWCEFSLDCPIPIMPVSSMNINDILVRFDYFNYEINRIIREEQITIAAVERKREGILFDSTRLRYEFEDRGLTPVSDEFTRITVMTQDEINESIMEVEQTSDDIIRSLLYEDPDVERVTDKARDDPDIVYSEEEISPVVYNLLRGERFAIITREVARMGTSEMWNLINTIEAFKMYGLSKNLESSRFDDNSPDNKMLDMMKTYAESHDSLKEGYLFQVSRLNISDLSQLVRLIQGLISWRGLFHFIPGGQFFTSESELARNVLEGFSQEHGVDPSLFRMFIVR